MTKEDVKKILVSYDAEEKKGFYTYLLANHNACIERESDPATRYVVHAYTDRVLWETFREEEPGVSGFSYKGELTFTDIPDADDYRIVDPVNAPYCGMIHINDVSTLAGTFLANGRYQKNEDFRSTSLARRCINNIKAFINNQEYADEDGKIKDDNGTPLRIVFVGMGENRANAVEFCYDGVEFLICDDKYVREENKNRKHFQLQEWLFPHISNGLDTNTTLYIRTSGMNWYAGDKAKAVQTETKQALGHLMHHALIDAEIIDVRFPYRKKTRRKL